MSFKQEVLDKSESLELCYYKYIKVLNLKDSEGSFNLFIKDLFISCYQLEGIYCNINLNNSEWYTHNNVIVMKDGLCNRDYLTIGGHYMIQSIVKLHKILDEFKE